MAKQYGFLIDASRCTGCRTCEVACKDKHNLPVGRLSGKGDSGCSGRRKKRGRNL